MSLRSGATFAEVRPPINRRKVGRRSTSLSRTGQGARAVRDPRADGERVGARNEAALGHSRAADARAQPVVFAPWRAAATAFVGDPRFEQRRNESVPAHPASCIGSGNPPSLGQLPDGSRGTTARLRCPCNRRNPACSATSGVAPVRRRMPSRRASRTLRSDRGDSAGPAPRSSCRGGSCSPGSWDRCTACCDRRARARCGSACTGSGPVAVSLATTSWSIEYGERPRQGRPPCRRRRAGAPIPKDRRCRRHRRGNFRRSHSCWRENRGRSSSPRPAAGSSQAPAGQRTERRLRRRTRVTSARRVQGLVFLGSGRERESEFLFERCAVEGAHAVRAPGIRRGEEPNVVAGEKLDPAPDDPGRHAIDRVVLRREAGGDAVLGAGCSRRPPSRPAGTGLPNRRRGHQEAIELHAESRTVAARPSPRWPDRSKRRGVAAPRSVLTPRAHLDHSRVEPPNAARAATKISSRRTFAAARERPCPKRRWQCAPSGNRRG